MYFFNLGFNFTKFRPQPLGSHCHIVEETLAGREKQLKAYSVAIDVFGRGENFNPDTDTLVRAQATRLRELLDAYYHTEGLKIIQRSIDISRNPRVWQRIFLYTAMLETKTKKNRVITATLVSTQSEGFNGIVAFLANNELGNQERARDIIRNLDNGKIPTLKFLTRILLEQGFKIGPANKIIDRVIQSPVWVSLHNN